MNRPLVIPLANSDKTAFCGQSLALSLYRFPLTILLVGPLGAGKTTFLQGFAKGLGIEERVTSPTFALEQHYQTSLGLPFIHLDLYRLTEKQALEQIRSTEEHEGIRCIEWADRIQTMTLGDATMSIALKEVKNAREMEISFDDFPLPSSEQIDAWRRDVRLPQHILDHCEGVAACAVRLGKALVDQGTVVRLDAVDRAGKLHDLLRFIDFREGAGPESGLKPSDEDMALWAQLREKYRTIREGMKHEEACARFLREQGYGELASIVEVHGLTIPTPERSTTEQKLLYYADKRVQGDKFVSLQERFEDFRARYSGGKNTDLSMRWYEEARKTERELFPSGVPF